MKLSGSWKRWLLGAGGVSDTILRLSLVRSVMMRSLKRVNYVIKKFTFGEQSANTLFRSALRLVWHLGKWVRGMDGSMRTCRWNLKKLTLRSRLYKSWSSTAVLEELAILNLGWVTPHIILAERTLNLWCWTAWLFCPPCAMFDEQFVCSILVFSSLSWFGLVVEGNSFLDRQLVRPTDGKTDEWTDRLTYRQTDNHMEC